MDLDIDVRSGGDVAGGLVADVGVDGRAAEAQAPAAEWLQALKADRAAAQDGWFAVLVMRGVSVSDDVADQDTSAGEGDVGLYGGTVPVLPDAFHTEPGQGETTLVVVQ